MQLLIRSSKNQGISPWGFAQLEHLPRSPVFQFRFHSLVAAVFNLGKPGMRRWRPLDLLRRPSLKPKRRMSNEQEQKTNR
jgi:hypothetical protein